MDKLHFTGNESQTKTKIDTFNRILGVDLGSSLLDYQLGKPDAVKIFLGYLLVSLLPPQQLTAPRTGKTVAENERIKKISTPNHLTWL